MLTDEQKVMYVKGAQRARGKHVADDEPDPETKDEAIARAVRMAAMFGIKLDAEALRKTTSG